MKDITPQQIHQVLKSRFNGEELITLCFELEIEYDDLPAVAREGKARELVARMERLGRLSDLITLIEHHRPQVVWQAEPQADEADIEQVPGEPPYKGMAYFDEADAHLFFGREALTAELLTRVNQHPFLAVVGASGSGKSSLVRAGLIPALKGAMVMDEVVVRPEGSENWLYRIITPTDRPLEALADCLSDSAKALRDNSDLMAKDERGLHFAVRYLLKEQGADRLCLVVDQFEELFTLCRNPQERQAFIDNLLNAAMPNTGGLPTLILTLRADFYAHCAQYDGLRQALEAQQKYIGAMNREELHRAITEPAKRQGWAFEPGLVEMLLQDVGQKPGRLPLLSHALLETWERRRGQTLTFAGYIGAGGLYGAIAQTAETEFNKLNSSQQAIARNIFLRLTELGEGSEDTRRRVPLPELMLQPEQASEVTAVLAQLASARLITTSQEAVEVVHEALIREWDLLRRWLNEDREGLQIQRRLTEAAAEWQTLGQDEGLLYRGLRLAQVQERHEAQSQWLNVVESEFLQASQALQAREEAERQAQQQRELEQARQLAEAERQRAELQQRSASQLRRLVRMLLVVLLAMISLALLTSALYSRSRQAENLANARLLVAQGKAVFEEDPLLGLALIVEGWALVRDEDDDVQATVLDDDSRQRVFQWGRFIELESGIEQVVVSPNESWLVVNYRNTLWQLQQAKDGLLITTLAGDVDDVTFSPNDKWLVVDYKDAVSELRQVANGSVIETLTEETTDDFIEPLTNEKINDVIFSPNGNWLVVDYWRFPGELRQAADGSVIETLMDQISFFGGGAYFSPNGNWLVVNYYDAPSELRHGADGSLFKILRGVIFSPNGNRMVVDYRGAPSELLYGADGSVVETLSGVVVYAAFSPNDDWLVVNYLWQSDKLLRATDGSVIETLTGSVKDVTFSPNNKWLVVNYVDSPDELRQAADGAVIETFAADIRFGGVTFSPNGNWLVLDYRDSTSELRHGADGSLFKARMGSANHFIFSPSDNWLAVDYWDGPVELLRGADGSLFESMMGEVDSIIFSPNDMWLVVSYTDGKSQLWNSEGVPLADLGVNMQNVIFLPLQERLVIQHRDGTAYLLDLAWLEAMNGRVDTLLPRELVQLACDYPLAHGALDEAALQGYLDELGIPAPQACQ